MALTAKALREQRAAIYKEIRKLSDTLNENKRDFTAEEQQSWDKMNADYNALSRQVDVLERTEKLEAEQRAIVNPEPGREDRRGDDGRDDPDRGDDLRGDSRSDRSQPGEEDRALVVQAFMRHQMDIDLEKRHELAVKRCKVKVHGRVMDIKLADRRQLKNLQREMRALSALDQSKGGVLNPDTTLVGSFERAMLAFGGMRDVATILRTSRGEDMTIPTADDTSNEGELLGENQAAAGASGTETDIATGGITWSAYKFSSKFLKVPRELIEDVDAAFDLVAFVGDALGERIARRQNRAFTTGTAASQPNGITNVTTGKTTASGTAITMDEVLDLIASVDPSYRMGAGFMLHDTVLTYLRKLKDSQGRYLLSETGNAVAGPVGQIWGYPYTINQHMSSSITSGNTTMVFGQLKKYVIRDVNTIRLRRLVERFAEKDQEGFIAFMRSDGNILNAGTNPIKKLVQA